MLKPQEKQFKNRFNVTESNNFISKKKNCRYECYIKQS